MTKYEWHRLLDHFPNYVTKLQVELQDCERGREADLADRARARLPRGPLLQQRLQSHVDRRPSQAAKLQGRVHAPLLSVSKSKNLPR